MNTTETAAPKTTIQERVDAIAYDEPPTTYRRKRTSRFSIPELPKDRKFLGLKLRPFLGICVVCLSLLGLILGLSIGLTRPKNSSQFLPLPSDRQSFQGDLTYYGPGLGACGLTSTDTDNIVSISHFLFDFVQHGTNPNSNPLCSLTLRATRVDSRDNQSKSVDLDVVDRCTGCQPTDLDVSPGAFDQLADPALGRIAVTWAWLSPAPTGLLDDMT